MRKTATAADARRYHHGDLRRALIDAARRILEAEGPTALSLRAVAREAGVSPAAPYHHFKDKGELLDAVADEGWRILNDAMKASGQKAGSPRAAMASLGVAYVCFAREHPALYRVMYKRSRDKEGLPEHLKEGEDSAYCRTRDTLIAAGADTSDAVGLELATIAAWCAAHGLAEIGGFEQFAPLKDALGGDEAFFRGVFEHMGVFARGHRD